MALRWSNRKACIFTPKYMAAQLSHLFYQCTISSVLYSVEKICQFKHFYKTIGKHEEIRICRLYGDITGYKKMCSIGLQF